MTQQQAIKKIREIRKEQDKNYPDHRHTPAEWFIILRNQLSKVEKAWYEGGNTACLDRVAHLGACAVACLEDNSPNKRVILFKNNSKRK